MTRATDPNNLAVVYLITGPVAEAEKEVQSAEKAGYKVSGGLREEIRKKRG
jgi:hypothetical protein